MRRELVVNFVTFDEHYDAFRALPDWAKKTLAKCAGWTAWRRREVLGART